MNSNYSKSNQSKPPSSSSVSLNNFSFDFDLAIGSIPPKSLNAHKNPNPPSYSYSTPSSHPNKPSWTHQPAPVQTTQTGLPGGPTSMVGDIFGKTWGSIQPSCTSTIGIINKNPNLFGDLVTSALGQPPNKTSSTSNFPLNNATPLSNKVSSFSIRNITDSLPKNGNFAGLSGNSLNANKIPILGGPSGIGINSNNNINSNEDPFSSLAGGIGSKPSASKPQKINSEGNGSKPTPTTSFPSNDSAGIDIDFNGFAASNQTASGGGDPMDMFFSASSATSAGGVVSGGLGGKPASEMDDWGLESEGFGGHDAGGTTNELEVLPPPPVGISGSTAKGKGMDSYKQGQFADAIKWLSWSVILLEKAGDNAATMEVFSSRASCYKEVGEYKKAVADCTKVLENDETNVSVLVQRALLYESMEKYKLGAEDLRTVLKIDPSNRIAKSTVHRLAKMEGQTLNFAFDFKIKCPIILFFILFSRYLFVSLLMERIQTRCLGVRYGSCELGSSPLMERQLHPKQEKNKI
ncbi:putative tetratricopeptide-like helical domain-containing protein [Lupinus albus]|uniref:Putative tetratricopeptide-like helical domain-containing protein n=1 Tax=Lupinus albus TaxID=3870 RepID=A0A6A4Q7Y6_LUPAL|nr:putative tetratricopeptide-like helical domain-containing protein [Lupinus albus]